MQGARETSVNKWMGSLQTNVLKEWAKRAENAAGYTQAHTHTQNKLLLILNSLWPSFRQDTV